jgi:hypothetical protein
MLEVPDSGRVVESRRQATWSVKNFVDVATRKIVEWSADNGGEHELLLPVTEDRRNATVEF